MITLEFGKTKVEVKNELHEMTIQEWMDVSNILNEKTPVISKYYKLLERLGVKETLIDEMTKEELKTIMGKLKFKADEDLELQDEIVIGERTYKHIGFNAKIHTYIEKEVVSSKPDWSKVAAYLYKLEGSDMSEHIATTKDRAKRFNDNLMADDIIPIIDDVIKTVNEFTVK